MTATARPLPSRPVAHHGPPRHRDRGSWPLASSPCPWRPAGCRPMPWAAVYRRGRDGDCGQRSTWPAAGRCRRGEDHAGRERQQEAGGSRNIVAVGHAVGRVSLAIGNTAARSAMLRPCARLSARSGAITARRKQRRITEPDFPTDFSRAVLLHGLGEVDCRSLRRSSISERT